MISNEFKATMHIVHQKAGKAIVFERFRFQWLVNHLAWIDLRVRLASSKKRDALQPQSDVVIAIQPWVKSENERVAYITSMNTNSLHVLVLVLVLAMIMRVEDSPRFSGAISAVFPFQGKLPHPAENDHLSRSNRRRMSGSLPGHHWLIQTAFTAQAILHFTSIHRAWLEGAFVPPFQTHSRTAPVNSQYTKRQRDGYSSDMWVSFILRWISNGFSFTVAFTDLSSPSAVRRKESTVFWVLYRTISTISRVTRIFIFSFCLREILALKSMKVIFR